MLTEKPSRLCLVGIAISSGLARQRGETMGQSAATDCSSHFLFRKWRFLGEDTGCVLARAVEELSLATFSTSSRPAGVHGRALGRLL